MENIMKAYRQLLPPQTITQLAKEIDGWPNAIAQTELFNSISHPTCLEFPPSRRYIKRVLKTIIDEIEKDGEEVVEPLLDLLFQHLQEEEKREEFFYRAHYVCSDDLPIISREVDGFGGDLGTGGKVWEATESIIEFIMNNTEAFENLHVVELGAGVGLPGIAIAMNTSAQCVVLTDLEHSILRNTLETVKCNRLQVVIDECVDPWQISQERIQSAQKQHLDDLTRSRSQSCLVYIAQTDWDRVWEREVPPLLQSQVIIGSDLIYAPELAQSLARALSKLLDGTLNHCISLNIQMLTRALHLPLNDQGKATFTSPVCILATTLRNPSTFGFFLSCLEQNNLQYCELLLELQFSDSHSLDFECLSGKSSLMIIWRKDP